LTLPSRCATYDSSKASPTGPKLSRQVRSEPACIPVTGCAEPGVARVQAVELNPEICIVVVQEDNLPIPRKGKPTPCSQRKAAVLSYDMASEGGHHRGLRAGHVLTGVARELGRAHCLPATRCRYEGCRLTKRALALTVRFPTASEPSEGIRRQGKTAGCWEASDERSDPGRTVGSLSRA